MTRERLYQALDRPAGRRRLPLLRRHLRAGLRDARARPGPRLPGYDGSLELLHAAGGAADRGPRSAASASCSSPRGWCVLLFVAYQLVWTNYEAHRAGRPRQRRHPGRLEPTARGGTTGGPDTGRRQVDFGQGFAFLHIPRLGQHWTVPVVEGRRAAGPRARRRSLPGHGPARPGRQLRRGRAPGHQRRAVRQPGPGARRVTSSSPRPDAAGSPTSSTGPDRRRRRRPGSSTRCRASRAPTPTERLITLTTCNPRWASTQRLIVFGHLEESRAKTDGRRRRARPGERGGLMYAWIWRHLPGPWPLRSLLAAGAGGGRGAAAVHDRVPLGGALPALPRRDGGPVTDLPARRRGSWSSTTTTASCSTSCSTSPSSAPSAPCVRNDEVAPADARGLRRRAAQPRARDPGEGRRLRRPGPRGRRRGAGARRLPRPPGDRGRLRRRRRTGPRAAARQDQRGAARGRRRPGRAAVAVHRDPLPLARGAARTACRPSSR